MGYGGWEGDARGRGYGDICIRTADSICYTAETNTPLYSNYTLIKMLKRKRFIENTLELLSESKCLGRTGILFGTFRIKHLSGDVKTAIYVGLKNRLAPIIFIYNK